LVNIKRLVHAPQRSCVDKDKNRWTSKSSQKTQQEGRGAGRQADRHSLEDIGVGLDAHLSCRARAQLLHDLFSLRGEYEYAQELVTCRQKEDGAVLRCDEQVAKINPMRCDQWYHSWCRDGTYLILVQIHCASRL